ncbi:hypothetical protein MPSEU_000754800 [Mayamaea pseudoterrestris]|nr:hypothetical protein MPSEU_000754800 [Mayamaea pseudoterrestris]
MSDILQQEYLIDLACAKCGRFQFSDASSAHCHASKCDGKRRNTTGPWMCKGCGKRSFTRSQAFGSHRSGCMTIDQMQSGVTDDATFTSVGSLKPTSLGCFRVQLSDYNYLLTEWIGFVQVSAQDAALPTNRRRNVEFGDIGVQCLACARATNCGSTGSSVMHPGRLGHVAAVIYNLADRHFIKNSCINMPARVKRQFIELKLTSTSQSMSKNRIGLPVYLNMVFEALRLENRPNKQKGIVVCGSASLPTTVHALSESEAASYSNIDEPVVAAPLAVDATASEGNVTSNEVMDARESTLLEWNAEATRALLLFERPDAVNDAVSNVPVVDDSQYVPVVDDSQYPIRTAAV